MEEVEERDSNKEVVNIHQETTQQPAGTKTSAKQEDMQNNIIPTFATVERHPVQHWWNFSADQPRIQEIGRHNLSQLSEGLSLRI